jgi:hypothetical protein
LEPIPDEWLFETDEGARNANHLHVNGNSFDGGVVQESHFLEEIGIIK